MTENTIIIDTVIDTEYGEKALLRTDGWNREHVKAMPWAGDEGTFEAAAKDQEGEMLLEPDELQAIEDEFGTEVDEDFATHSSFDWDREVWTVDTDSLDEAVRFLEALGWEVENKVARQLEA